MKAAPAAAVTSRVTRGTTASGKARETKAGAAKTGAAAKPGAGKPASAKPAAAPRQQAKAAPVVASKPPAARKPAAKASESPRASGSAKPADTARPAEAAKAMLRQTGPAAKPATAAAAAKPAASAAAKPSTPAMKRTSDPVNGISNATTRPTDPQQAAPAPKAASPRAEAPRPEAPKSEAPKSEARIEPRPAAPRPPSRPGFAEAAQAPAPVPPPNHAPPRHMGPPPRIASKAETFVEGDHVVYPTHGVGKVERIAIEDIAGHRLELIHITFEENRMTLRVPVAKARSAGLRKLATRKMFDEALGVLKGRARVKRTMWSRRAQEYEAKINSGDPLAIAEVVRDLHRNAGQPDQSFSERQIYELAMDRLAAELAALDQTDKSTAVVKLAEFLKTV